MKRACSVCIVIFLFGLGSSPFGQTQSFPSIQRPCADEKSPGRPTLKRRQPIEEEASTETVVDSTALVQTCEPGHRETKSDDQPAEIHFEGLKAVSELDLVRVLRTKTAALTNNTVLDFGVLRRAEETIKQFLVESGYRHATVSSRIENSTSGQPVAMFIVSEGSRSRIAEIRFEEGKVFSSQFLAAEMLSQLARYERLRDGYDPDIFEYCLGRLNNFVRSQGYLQANFRDPQIEESNGELVISIKGNEGPLYHLGSLKIDGSSVLLPEQIVAMLGMKTGDIADGERLSKFLFEELKQYYGERGFIQYTAEVTPAFKVRPGTSYGIADFEITIDEGPRFKIRKISFAGEKLPDAELRGLLLLRDGDVYNQKLLEQCINNLNEMGWFQFIDKDKDTDFRTNEEAGLVDITITLTRKEG